MINESITVDEVLAILNSAVEADRDGMQRLIEARVPCNEALANHETIQVLHKNSAQPNLPADYLVGLLGLLNGLFGISETGFGIISAVYDDNEKLTGFERTDDKYLKGEPMVVQMSDVVGDNE